MTVFDPDEVRRGIAGYISSIDQLRAKLSDPTRVTENLAEKIRGLSEFWIPRPDVETRIGKGN